MTWKIRFAIFSKKEYLRIYWVLEIAWNGKILPKSIFHWCAEYSCIIFIAVNVYTRADNYLFHHVPLIMRRHELSTSLRNLFISGSTGSNKSLETGKYSITYGSTTWEYFTDASSILALSFYHSQCYVYTAHVPTNAGIMFQFSFVLCTINIKRV